MLTIYTKNGCSSSRKAMEYLKANKIPYKRVKLNSERMSPNELELIIENSYKQLMIEDGPVGLEAIIKRTYQMNVMDMKLTQLKKKILRNPTILKTPITIDKEKFIIGFKEEEFSVFVSKEKRHQHLEELMQHMEESVVI